MSTSMEAENRTPTTFTVIMSESGGGEWPTGWDKTVSLMEGELADKIRARLGVHERTPVVIEENRIDGGYSESTQENDYYFELRVGENVIELPDAYNQIDALSRWLGDER